MTEEHRRFLEFAYIGRAQELSRHGNRDASRRVVENLLELGITEPSVEAALPDLLASIGMLDQLPTEQRELGEADRNELRTTAADHAVLRPDEAPKSMQDIRAGAERIRSALAALESGDEQAALVCLKGIARNSPFADWRYFVRGLAAYYRHNAGEMAANWDRLAADRFPVESDRRRHAGRCIGHAAALSD